MSFSLAPLVPPVWLAVLAALALILAGLGLARRQRGMILRSAALALLALAIANPSVLMENREALTTIVPVIVDESASQQLPERKMQTQQALSALKTQLAKFPGIEPRIVEAREDVTTDRPSTRLFAALSSAISDVAPSRLGAAILITDGQIHDIPDDAKRLGMEAPVHGLITGREQEFDRRIEVVKGPRFGIVNAEQDMSFRVIDDGKVPPGPANVSIRINGEALTTLAVEPGKDTTLSFKVPRGGNNILDFRVDEVPGELTTANNQATHILEGIRQNLRVLLVSGEPHAGERAWRNLLKSDASVDLVHFTILRPPEKQDGTPINELSLIAFPTRELFVDKINDFDLIIFDRYQHRGVLPILYYDNIAQYVRGGGALLIAAGPEHAGEDSIASTPLSAVLPASPTGEMDMEPFYPRLSDIGKKHPVTRGLDGSQTEPPRWGRWFRTVDVAPPQGEVVMKGAGSNPLLVLNREGKGRVAMLLSDQGWLWARGFEGGGPYVSLYRRIAHWLMQEPALEEEALTARALGRTIEITRQTIGDAPGTADITLPDGQKETVTLSENEPGLYRATLATSQTGLYAITNGTLTTLVHNGAVDAPEFKETISSTDTLAPLAKATFGLVKRVADAGGKSTALPQILPVNGPIRYADDSRMQIRMTDETILKGINQWPLLSGLLGLAALLMVISATWWREGR